MAALRSWERRQLNATTERGRDAETSGEHSVSCGVDAGLQLL